MTKCIPGKMCLYACPYNDKCHNLKMAQTKEEADMKNCGILRVTEKIDGVWHKKRAASAKAVHKKYIPITSITRHSHFVPDYSRGCFKYNIEPQYIEALFGNKWGNKLKPICDTLKNRWKYEGVTRVTEDYL